MFLAIASIGIIFRQGTDMRYRLLFKMFIQINQNDPLIPLPLDHLTKTNDTDSLMILFSVYY